MNQPDRTTETDKRPDTGPDDAAATQRAREDLRRAEAGDKAAAERLGQEGAADPKAAEAAEQEASDGPDGMGLAR